MTLPTDVMKALSRHTRSSFSLSLCYFRLLACLFCFVPFKWCFQAGAGFSVSSNLLLSESSSTHTFAMCRSADLERPASL